MQSRDVGGRVLALIGVGTISHSGVEVGVPASNIFYAGVKVSVEVCIFTRDKT